MRDYSFLLEKAKNLSQQEKYDNAIEIYEELLSSYKDSYLYFEIGKNYFFKGFFIKAKKYLKEYIYSDKCDKNLMFSSYLFLIKIYKNTNKFRYALFLCERIKEYIYTQEQTKEVDFEKVNIVNSIVNTLNINVLSIIFVKFLNKYEDYLSDIDKINLIKRIIYYYMDQNKVGEIISLLEKIEDKELIEEIIEKAIDKINKGIKEKEYKNLIYVNIDKISRDKKELMVRKLLDCYIEKDRTEDIMGIIETIEERELLEEIIAKSIDKVNRGIKEKEYKKIIDENISNNIFIKDNYNKKKICDFNKILNYNVVNLQKLNIDGQYDKVKQLAKKLKNIAVPNAIKKKYDNIILNELEIAEHKIVLESKPRFLYCTITSSCNIKCIMCTVYNHSWEISDKLFKNIVDFLPYLETVVWQGGEVFLYKNFDELLDVAGKYKVGQELVTNAILLNEKRILKLIDYNVNLGISIDGLTKEVYESIRVGSDFNKLIRNLEILKSNLKDENKLRLNVLVMDNIEQIQYYPEFAKKYGFSTLCVNTISPNTKIKENIFYYNTNKKYESQIMNIKKILKLKCEDLGIELIDTLPNYILDDQEIKSNEYNENNENEYDEKNNEHSEICECNENNESNNNIESDNIFNNDYKNNEENKVSNKKLFCRVPWQRMYIDSFGLVVPECFCDFDISIGFVQNNSLEEIWNGDKMQEYRKSIIDNNQNKICSYKCLKREFNDNIINRIIDTEPFRG